MKKILFLLLTLLFLNSCLTELSNEDIAKSQINNVLLNIKDGFNELDIAKIMYEYDNDFLHKGKYKFEEKFIWQDRMTAFTYLDISDVHIEIDEDFAVVYFLATYSKYGNQTHFIEPDENGDMSFFRKINGQWKVYGNRQYY
ncbi:MAG TPA: hypothetical protein PLV22_08640 [Candidatus Cloacimonadota bacterium]|nr:hypothetical protein [Candidatus Cloacimonadota bacterium]HOQ80728.1 hypothetical protein [Candidatus Cloacimonadota bacterium]